MGKAHRPGGLYRNASGVGFHDALGREIPISEVPPELLNADELKQLGPTKPKVVGTITPKIEETEPNKGAPPPADELPTDFPGYEQLVAVGLGTKAAVFAHPDLGEVKGIGPKTVAAIEALRPKAAEA